MVMKRKIIGALLSALIFGFAAVIWAFPVTAAILCPSCLGMERIAPDLIVERGMERYERELAAKSVASARERVAAVLGEVRIPVIFVACDTATCKQRLGRRSGRGFTTSLPGLAIIELAPNGVNPVVMTHELTHAQLRALAGWFVTYPQWFDEGLAVVISRDPRFLATKTDPGGCLFESKGQLPEIRSDWLVAAGDRSRMVYGEAACAVRHWLDANGGYGALQGVIGDARSGKRSLP